MILHKKTHTYLITILLIILQAATAQAEKIIVKKVKGKQAIIESTSQLEEGQTYELASDPISDDVNFKTETLKSRSNSMTFGANLDFVRSDTVQSNTAELQFRYGWNFTSLEIGALLQVSSSDAGNGATTSLLGGGYFDYNMVANRGSKKIIYGPFALAGFGSTTYPSSGTGGSSSVLMANLGGFLTYFIGDTSTALRAEAYGAYQQVNTSTAQNALTGGGIRALLLLYF